jgi:hypothetical protein
MHAEWGSATDQVLTKGEGHGGFGAEGGEMSCAEKCRGRGQRVGAEDGERWAERVSVHAADRHIVHGPHVCGGWRVRRLLTGPRPRGWFGGTSHARGRGPPLLLDAEVAQCRGGGERVR